MLPQNLNFWSISRKESLESQQKHAHRNRFLRTLLFSNDFFNPGYNREMLMRKRTSILDWVCFNYEQLFHPVQSTACRICQCNSQDKLVLPEVTGILLVLDELHHLSGKKCFINCTQYWTCLYQSGRSRIRFSYHYLLSILGNEFLL